jgi:N-acetylneuraminic acid mutarotase
MTSGSERLCANPPLVEGYRNDIYRFSPASNAWTALSVASPPLHDTPWALR